MKRRMITVVVALTLLVACGGPRDASTSSTAPASIPPAAEAASPERDLFGALALKYVPLYTAATPVIEQIQYREADGTLVTSAGFRPTNRHSREGGEPWTSTTDQGPGDHFSFPTFYFQNRSYGLVIRDEVPAGRQKITVYLKPNVGTFVDSGFSAFRRIDPGVIEYGWKLNVGFDNTRDGTRRCPAGTTLDTLCVAQTIGDYWRSGDEGRADNVLRVGDKIEMSPAQFLDHAPGSDKALIDGGGIRYYSFEQLYVVGKGMAPWYGVAPRLDSQPLPDDALLGGQASVSYNYSEEPHRVFQQTVNNIGIANMQRFVEGRRLFHTSFLDGKHSESPDINPVFSQHASQLGSRYNELRCLGCHTLNGRSPAPGVGSPLHQFSVLVAAASTRTSLTPDPTYGLNIQQQSPGGPDYSVSVQSYNTSLRRLPDGQQVELQQPVYAFKGPLPAQFSVRQAPQVIGMGLLEAVDETTILALSDPTDANGDGVRGVPNWSTDPETGQRHLGRFGWKAGKGTVRQQAAGAFLQDMGVTSSAYKVARCQRAAPDCQTAASTPSVSAAELTQLAAYIELIGVPAQRKYPSGYTDGAVTPPEHQLTASTTATINRGAQFFAQVGCAACHVATLKTGPNHPFAELRTQTIHPYTDLLLHDMGPELADTLTEGEGTPRLWRTQPLWGLGSLKYVQTGTGQADPQRVRYLHDGRARTLLEATLWHGGEAAASRVRFEALSKADREAVLAFIDSL
jgi:CxxC motif-containing protein (DUF1111 family)